MGNAITSGTLHGGKKKLLRWCLISRTNKYKSSILFCSLQFGQCVPFILIKWIMHWSNNYLLSKWSINIIIKLWATQIYPLRIQLDLLTFYMPTKEKEVGLAGTIRDLIVPRKRKWVIKGWLTRIHGLLWHALSEIPKETPLSWLSAAPPSQFVSATSKKNTSLYWKKINFSCRNVLRIPHNLFWMPGQHLTSPFHS